MVEWKSIQVPEDLVNDVNAVIKKMPHWIGVNDFVRDAVREKIAKVQEQANRTEDCP